MWYKFSILFCTAMFLQGSPKDQKDPVNVLFIAVDDLRPELNCYGQSHISSPHLDQLATEGFLFSNAYCNVAVCGASRASIMTGLRPTPKRFLDFNVRVDEEAPGVLTLPQHFKNHGYHTASLGKVLHHANDAVYSWSESPWHPRMEDKGTTGFRNYQLAENIKLEEPEDQRGPPFENADVADDAYYDGKVANKAIEKLNTFSVQDEPFFLAVGFMKPHLPFNAPTPYWDLYDPNDIKLPDHRYMPNEAPEQAQHSFGELRNYYGVPSEGQVSDAMAKTLIHGYYASVSYVDAMIGRVLQSLKDLGLDQNTIVILWGDHGWSLMDHGLWCKHSTFNVAMQTPLFLKIPGTQGGKSISSLTEYVDIYPTLCQLAGLPIPSHTQGEDFSKAMLDPTNYQPKESIYCRWKPSDAIKTERYLYTAWYNKKNKRVAHMLYDHQADPNETVNIADLPENKDLVKKFNQQLRIHRNQLLSK